MSRTQAPLDRGFHGRTTELVEATRALESSKLVVLVGPGGIGKTRLARVVAARFEAPVFCDLSAARSRDDVVGALAGALGVSLRGDDAQGVEQVASALASRGPTLVVLDNLDAIGDGLGVVARWLELGPAFLGTSRTRPNVERERIVELGPLERAAALALFVERGRAVAPELVVDATTETLVAKLDGNPLAIELAAARAHVLPPAALLARFARHLDVLHAEGLPDRHRSLRAVVQGSWALCDERDRGALAAASVFCGGFDLAGAEAVIGEDAADRIQSLLASSLLFRTASAGTEPRFGVYESVRELAAERLAERPEQLALARSRHAEHYRRIASALSGLARKAEPAALAEGALEADNLAAAFRTAGRSALAFDFVFARALSAEAHVAVLVGARDRLGAQDDLAGAELEVALARATRRTGDAARTVAQATRAVERARAAGAPRLLAEATLMRAAGLYDAGKPREASSEAREAIELGGAAQDPEIAARASSLLGFVSLEAGDLVVASQCADAAIALACENGLVLVEQTAENLLAGVHAKREDYPRSEAHLRRALSLVRGKELWSEESMALGNLGKLLVLAGRPSEARTILEDALALSRRFGMRRLEFLQLATLGGALAALGLLAAARAAAAQAERGARELGHPRVVVQASLVLGSIALQEDRAEEAAAHFERAASFGGPPAARDPRAPQAQAEQGAAAAAAAARFEIVTRAGVQPGETPPPGADVSYDALERRVLIDGRAIDLRKKPVLAHLLEVVLSEPCAAREKAELYEGVWHQALREASQHATLYKAVDRLAHLLDPDPRRFLRWDESGRLVLVAKRPALVRPAR